MRAARAASTRRRPASGTTRRKFAQNGSVGRPARPSYSFVRPMSSCETSAEKGAVVTFHFYMATASLPVGGSSLCESPGDVVPHVPVADAQLPRARVATSSLGVREGIGDLSGARADQILGKGATPWVETSLLPESRQGAVRRSLQRCQRRPPLECASRGPCGGVRSSRRRRDGAGRG